MTDFLVFEEPFFNKKKSKDYKTRTEGVDL